MDSYLVLLCLGFGGLSLMAVSGAGHRHHGSGRGGGRPAGRHHARGTGRGHVSQQRHGGATRLLTLLSPRVLSSLLLGCGATGLILRPLFVALPAWQLAALSVGGAWAFERGIIQPVWQALFRFASNPARTLESTLLEEGRAATNFDAAGDGLVILDLDGQVRQILGTLCAEDRAAGRRVRAGDRVFVRAVDARRNRCTVAKVG